MYKNPPGYMTTLKERTSWWSFFVGQNVYYNITAIFLSTYLLLQGIDPVKSGAVLLIVKAWDAINDPIFGFLCDKVKFKSGQKCMPWVRLATALIPIVTIAVFSIPGGLSDTGKLVWFAVAYLLWDTVYTISDVPVYSMLTTMTDNLDERSTLLSVNRVFSGAGYAVCLVAMTLLISENVGMSYTWAVVLVSLISVLTMIPLSICGKERNYKPQEDNADFTLGQMLSYLGKNKYLLIFYGAYMLTHGLKTGDALALMVSYYLFGSSVFNIVLTLLGMLPGLVAAVLMPPLLRKFDKYHVLMVCTILAIVLGLAIYFVGWQNQVTFMVLTVLRAIPLSICGILYFLFTPDCAEYGQYKSGITAKGITFSIQTFSVKITGAISSALGLALLGLFSWISVKAESFEELEKLGVMQPPEALEGLWFVYALVPVIGLTLGAVCLTLYKLRDKDVQIMSSCNSGQISREEAQEQLSRKY